MKKEQDYFRDLVEIRTMMERSSKFVLLSGWSGIMAGIYALAGAYIANRYYDFSPQTIANGSNESLKQVVPLALVVLGFALSTAVYFSSKKAKKRGERLWNPTARQLLISMAVPFLVGGILILILISAGLIGLVAPFSLIFYGLALFNASNFTYQVVKVLGLTELALGLLGAYFVDYGLILWVLGFGVAHIIYGVYVYYRYER